MNSMETRKYEMLVRVRDFGEAYTERLAGSTLAKPLFAAVASAVAELQANDITRQSTARGGGINGRDEAREALLQSIDELLITARAVALDTAGLSDKFVMPKKPKDQELLTTVRLFAQEAAPFEAAFIAHGLPTTFLADFTGVIDGFDRALRGHDQGKDYNASARAVIEGTLEAGATAVQKLNAIVTNQLKGDTAAMARWYRDRKVRYPRGGRSVQPTPADPSSVTQPTPVVSPPAPVVVMPQPAPAADPSSQPVMPPATKEAA